MPNRSEYEYPSLPVIYEYVTAQYPEYTADKSQPVQLQVYDVTFLHFHNLIEIGLCVSGEGICYVDGEEYPFRAGDVQIVFPFQSHLSKNTGEKPSRWYWLNVDGTELLTKAGFTDVALIDRAINQEMGLSGILNREEYPRICQLAETMVYEVFDPRPERVHRLEYYASSFLMLLMELCEASGQIRKIPPKSSQRLKEIAPALLRIKTDVNEGVLPEVAGLPELCGMSVANFRRKFKTAVGISPKEYITACCIHRACRLLLGTDEKIIEISSQCGFHNVSGLNRCFLKYTGVTPSEYRKRI